MITYTWKLTSLKKRNVGSLNDVVFQTYWQKTGTDENGNTGTFSGATPFDPSKIDQSSFVSFEQLTEAVVLEWIKGVVIGSYEEHVNGEIARQIESKKITTSELSAGQFPWDPPTSGVAPSGVAP
jgi:hypothetical protein